MTRYCNNVDSNIYFWEDVDDSECIISRCPSTIDINGQSWPSIEVNYFYEYFGTDVVENWRSDTCQPYNNPTLLSAHYLRKLCSIDDNGNAVWTQTEYYCRSLQDYSGDGVGSSPQSNTNNDSFFFFF